MTLLRKTIGILGGMGPYATILFQENIFRLTNANKDWDHIRTVVDNNTHIPSRSRAVLYGETSPLKSMVDCCKKLQNYPVDIIVIPCNSACFWVSEIKKCIKTPVVSIVDITLKAVSNSCRRKITKIAVLGGSVTYEKDLYKLGIKKLGFEYVKPDPPTQQKVLSVIEAVKLGGENSDSACFLFDKILKGLTNNHGVDAIILACTELSKFRDVSSNALILDSSSVLAKFVVDYVEGRESIPLDVTKVKDFWDLRATKVERQKLDLLQSSMFTSTAQQAKNKDEREKMLLIQEIGPLLNREDSLLELGCGYGRWSFILSQLVGEIDAYDYCQKYIQFAKKKALESNIRNINFSCSSVETLTLRKKYDCIFSVGLLHYLSDEQFDRVIQLFMENTKSHGLIVLRETFGVSKRFELHGYCSGILNTEYYAIYRTMEDLVHSIGDDFSVLHKKVFLPPTKSKPETFQGLVILKKCESHNDEL